MGIVGQGIIGWDSDIEDVKGIVGEGVGAQGQVVDLPVVIEVVLGEPVDSLGARGEGVGLEEVVEEGGVLLPYFIGLVYGYEAVLIVVGHLLN